MSKGIGIIAARDRRTLDASKFDYLFEPLDDPQRILLNKNASTEKTVELMIKLIEDYHTDVSKFAEFIKGKTVRETCHNIYKFLTTYIKYKIDDGEELRRPARVFWDRLADCDCGSIFWGACLKELKIPFKIRITKYEHFGIVGEWQHVYVVVPTKEGKDIICDFVMDEFDKEKKFAQEKSNFNMKSLGGIPVWGLLGIEGNGENYLMDVLNGTDLDDTDEGLLVYIKKTRTLVAANKTVIKGAEELLKMYDFAIKYWNTPHRDKALTKLAIYESHLIAKRKIDVPEKEWILDQNYLNGFVTEHPGFEYRYVSNNLTGEGSRYYSIHGLGFFGRLRLLKKLKDKVKKVAQKAKRTVKRTVKKAGGAVRRVGGGIKRTVKKAVSLTPAALLVKAAIKAKKAGLIKKALKKAGGVIKSVVKAPGNLIRKIKPSGGGEDSGDNSQQEEVTDTVDQNTEIVSSEQDNVETNIENTDIDSTGQETVDAEQSDVDSSEPETADEEQSDSDTSEAESADEEQSDSDASEQEDTNTDFAEQNNSDTEQQSDFDSSDQEDNDGEEDLGKIQLFKKIGNLVKKVVKVPGNIIKKASGVVKKSGSKVLNLVTKLNPLTIAIRNGLRVLFALNFKGASSAIANGYLSEAEAKAKNLDMDRWKKQHDQIEKIGAIFYKMGGNRSRLEKSIKNGAKRKALFTKNPKAVNLDGLGEPVSVGVSLASAGALFATILEAIKKAGLIGGNKSAENEAADTTTTVDNVNNLVNNGIPSSPLDWITQNPIPTALIGVGLAVGIGLGIKYLNKPKPIKGLTGIKTNKKRKKAIKPIVCKKLK